MNDDAVALFQFLDEGALLVEKIERDLAEQLAMQEAILPATKVSSRPRNTAKDTDSMERMIPLP